MLQWIIVLRFWEQQTYSVQNITVAENMWVCQKTFSQFFSICCPRLLCWYPSSLILVKVDPPRRNVTQDWRILLTGRRRMETFNRKMEYIITVLMNKVRANLCKYSPSDKVHNFCLWKLHEEWAVVWIMIYFSIDCLVW